MRFPLTLPDHKPFDAVGFGLNAVDHLIVVPEYPAFDTKLRLLEHKQAAGGQTASTMVALKRLGLHTAYAGRFGSDAEGQFGFQSLEAEGVNIEFAEVVEGAHNQLAFIIIDARSGERTIIWDRDGGGLWQFSKPAKRCRSLACLRCCVFWPCLFRRSL